MRRLAIALIHYLTVFGATLFGIAVGYQVGRTPLERTCSVSYILPFYKGLDMRMEPADPSLLEGSKEPI